jgi:DNA-directed RNA polymerase specialized sigma54-like protein
VPVLLSYPTVAVSLPFTLISILQSSSKEFNLDTLLQQLQESLLTNARPAQVAFHIYELLNEAGYEDEQIEEVSAALTDIVA